MLHRCKLETEAKADATLEVVRRLGVSRDDEDLISVRAYRRRPPAEAHHRVARVETEESLLRRVQFDDPARVEREVGRALGLETGGDVSRKADGVRPRREIAA